MRDREGHEWDAEKLAEYFGQLLRSERIQDQFLANAAKGLAEMFSRQLKLRADVDLLKRTLVALIEMEYGSVEVFAQRWDAVLKAQKGRVQ